MKYLLLSLCLSVGCAYGDPIPEQHYGHTKGNTNQQSDGGVDNTDWVDDQIPTGCYLDTAEQDGVVVYSFVICPNPNEQWKDIPDPPYYKQGTKQ